MKKQLLTSIFCLLHFCSFSQNFLWGRSGGSDDAPVDGKETVTDISTDQNGNTYVLATIASNRGRNIMGQTIPSYDLSDIVLSSFKADGTLRWVKVFGASSWDIPLGLQTDAKDGIYVAGFIDNGSGFVNGYISTDVILPATYKTMFLIKYDTAGIFQWYKTPEADTVGASAKDNNKILAMDVDDNGNTYLFCTLGNGLFQNSLNISTTGQYILKYDATGSFSYIKPDIQLDPIYISGLFEHGQGILNGISMKVDNDNGCFYLSGRKSSGGGNMIMGGNVISNGMYIGSFKLDGSFNWKRENNITEGGFYGRPSTDANGDIYLSGVAAAASSTTGQPAINFNGYEVTHGGGNPTPFIVKMNKNGDNIWAADADVNAAGGGTTLALRNGEVVLAGYFAGLLQWPGYTGSPYNMRISEESDMFITRFNSNTGAVLGMDKTNSSYFYNELPTCMADDGKGNVYIGGEFESDLNVNALNNLTTTGGKSDWFVVKYGDMWPSSLNDFYSKKEVIIYPSPAYNTIIIANGRVGTTIQLTDMTGCILHTQTLKSQFENMDISGYAPGNYTICLIGTNGKKITKKISKL